MVSQEEAMKVFRLAKRIKEEFPSYPTNIWFMQGTDPVDVNLPVSVPVVVLVQLLKEAFGLVGL